MLICSVPYIEVSFQEGSFSVALEMVEAVLKADCEPPSWTIEKGPLLAGSVAKAGEVAEEHLAKALSVLDKSNYGRKDRLAVTCEITHYP
jgi:hypothetical protein